MQLPCLLLVLLVRSLRDLRYSTEYTYLANSSLLRRGPEGYVMMYLRRPSSDLPSSVPWASLMAGQSAAHGCLLKRNWGAWQGERESRAGYWEKKGGRETG